ncbi:hypothetical protein, partial [Klebsiella pneumoniae]|uniref:hypothetical protein n=1 Tax=Klebsiella pneumoniae TaxID=573 RepID=UPI0027308C2D
SIAGFPTPVVRGSIASCDPVCCRDLRQPFRVQAFLQRYSSGTSTGLALGLNSFGHTNSSSGVSAMEQAFALLIERHETLRT